MSGRAWQAILLVLCLLVAQAHAQSRGELAAGGGERGTASTRGGDYGRRSPPPSSFGGSSSSYGSEQGSSGFVTTLGGGAAITLCPATTKKAIPAVSLHVSAVQQCQHTESLAVNLPCKTNAKEGRELAAH